MNPMRPIPPDSPGPPDDDTAVTQAVLRDYFHHEIAPPDRLAIQPHEEELMFQITEKRHRATERRRTFAVGAVAASIVLLLGVAIASPSADGPAEAERVALPLPVSGENFGPDDPRPNPQRRIPQRRASDVLTPFVGEYYGRIGEPRSSTEWQPRAGDADDTPASLLRIEVVEPAVMTSGVLTTTLKVWWTTGASDEPEQTFFLTQVGGTSQELRMETPESREASEEPLRTGGVFPNRLVWVVGQPNGRQQIWQMSLRPESIGVPAELSLSVVSIRSYGGDGTLTLLDATLTKNGTGEGPDISDPQSRFRITSSAIAGDRERYITFEHTELERFAVGDQVPDPLHGNHWTLTDIRRVNTSSFEVDLSRSETATITGPTPRRRE